MVRLLSWFVIVGGCLAGLFCFEPGLALGHAGSPAAGSDLTDSAATSKESYPKSIEIDGNSYTGDDLRLYVTYLVGENPKTVDAGKMVSEFILDHVAYDEAVRAYPDLQRSSAVLSGTRRFLIKVYVDPYLERIRGEINPSRDELLKTLPDPRPRYLLSVIVCRDQELLDKVMDELAKGDSFEKVAEEHSQGLTSEKGGRLPPIEEGNYVLFNEREFENIRELRKGDVSKPFKTRIGWVVAKLIDFQTPSEIKEGELDKNYAAILDAERGRAVSARMDALRQRAKVEIDKAVLKQVKELLDKGQPLTDALKSAAIATINGEPIFCGEISELRDFHSVESLETYLDRRVRNEILLGEALKDVAAGELSRRTGMATRRLVTRAFFGKKADSFGATQQEVEEFYAKNTQLFRTEERRKLLVIQNTDRKKVDEAARLAKKGKDFKALARKFNEEEVHRKIQGETSPVRKRDLRPEMRDAVFSAAGGAVLGPFTVVADAGKTNFILMKVEEISRPEVVPFEKLNRDVLVDKVVSRKMEDFFKGFLADVYKTHQIHLVN